MAEILVKKLKVQHQECSITFCGTKEIQALNRRYRSKNKPTDVLSFPMEDEKILGDIIIAIPVVKRQAKLYDNTFEEELIYLIIHGLCHLIGHDHDAAAKTKAMQKAEAVLIKLMAKFKLNITGRI